MEACTVNRKFTGPDIDPCGTPHFIRSEEDEKCPNSTEKKKLDIIMPLVCF